MEAGIVEEALGHTGGTASCSSKKVCTRCGESYGAVDTSRHGSTEIRGFVKASCTESGYTGDTYCTDCGATTETGHETAALGHSYTSKVTKQPTTDSEGVRTYTCSRCKHSYTEPIEKLKPQGGSDGEKPSSETTVSKKTAEKNALALNAKLKVSQADNKITVKWGKVSGADGYDVYVQYCGKKVTAKSQHTVKGNQTTKLTVKKVNGKKLNLKKNYKVYVRAYKMANGKKVTLGRTITAHVVGRKNTKYTNVKAIQVKKSSYSLKKGGTAKIKASTVLQRKNKKELSDAHAKKFRYASSNKKVATVSKAGKIKAVGKGKCTIYVYARNGCAKKIKVTV